MQPFINNNIYLICNGEIYNHINLKNKNNIKTKSNSDCEVIIYLYQLYGIETTCKMLDGVFSFVLYDKNINKIFVARDPFGVRPLFIGNNLENDLFISSELKAIHDSEEIVSANAEIQAIQTKAQEEILQKVKGLKRLMICY